MLVFDRRSVRQHRDRAAPTLSQHDFLLREVGERLVERLNDIRRQFPLALDIGCHDGTLARLLEGRGGIQTLLQSDLSFGMAAATGGLSIVADEEMLPFAPSSVDLVLSLLSLHWVNDLPGALMQIRLALRPDGLFLAAMLGGETLKELRQALTEAEIAVEGGLSPRIAPFADVRDAGRLLQRAGFALPVVDTECITVSYPDPFKLLQDLRGMGEGNAVLARRKAVTRRQTLFGAAARYREAFADAAGRIPATFQIIYLTGWAPDASQPQALRPGTAATRLAEVFGSKEIPAGERARP